VSVAAEAGAGLLERLDALAAERGLALQHDVPLGPLTTLRVGGPADRLLAPTTRDELLAALELARAAGTRPFVLGKGSDVVVADAGIRGLVIRNRADGISDEGQAVSVESGTAMAALVRHATRRGLDGLAFGISIPGSLGGAVWANAGAHGGEMRDLVRRVEAYQPASGTTVTLGATDCGFGYRESRFKHSDEVILAATLELRPGDPAAIAAEVDAHQAQRRATQPLADQNAGSVFRNPPGDFAGRLVDAAGLKGRRVGSAMVSPLHANFIVTDRGGTAADVRALGDVVRAEVATRFGITLEYEIEFVGDWPA
jgi:UDP-N-acetylmuramate dehydrogenase